MKRAETLVYLLVGVIVILFLAAWLLGGLEQATAVAGTISTAVFASLVILIAAIVVIGLLGKNVAEWLERRGS